MKKDMKAIGGGLAIALLLCASPALAQNQQPAVPSNRPAAQARPDAVDPGAVKPGGSSANEQATGNQQAGPSQLPAPKAATEAVQSHQGKAPSQ